MLRGVPTLQSEPPTLNVAPLMKVEVENQPHGLATLRIESAAGGCSQGVGLHCEQLLPLCPDSRLSRGQGARQVIEKKFRKEIQDELTKKLVSKSYHDAIAEKQLRVVSLTDLGDVGWRGRSIDTFRAHGGDVRGRSSSFPNTRTSRCSCRQRP